MTKSYTAERSCLLDLASCIRFHSSNNDDREMKIGSLHGRKNGEHIGVGFMEISKIFAMRDFCLFETHSFNGVL